MAIVTRDNFVVRHGTVSAVAASVILTVTTGACLIINAVSAASTNFSVNCVVAGVSVPLLHELAFSTRNNALYLVTASPAGLVTVSVAINLARCFSIIATSYVGQRTTATPFGTIPGTVSAVGVTNVNFSMSSSTNDMTVCFFAVSGTAATITVMASGTKVTSATCSATGARVVFAEKAGASTISWSATSSIAADWGVVGINIIASADSVAVARNFTLATMNIGY
jgi:hypothetical protein